MWEERQKSLDTCGDDTNPIGNMNESRLQGEYDALKSEYHIVKRKLDSKCEALLILSKDLDQCRQERDQFKLMAEQVQERYQALKRQLAGVGPRPTALDNTEFADMKSQSLAHLLCEMREVNKSLQFEVDDLKQKLHDAQGDIKLLREQIARQRVGTTDEGMNQRLFPAHEREDLVKQLEESQEQYQQLERDLQQVLDEKEEQVTERDVYKHKYERLNQELNYILKGDEKRVVDIDALVMENKYLQERLKQTEEEKTMAMQTVSKYKNVLEKKKTKGIMKMGQSRSGGVVITQKQVHQLIEAKTGLPPTPQIMSDLQSLAGALLETVNEKNMALSHQRKTNKILGGRVTELEKKLKTLEVAGLWSVPGGNKSSSLDKLKLEWEEIKTLVPRQASQGSDTSGKTDDFGEEKVDSNLALMPEESHANRTNGALGNSGLSLEDLDLLPTKEQAKHTGPENFSPIQEKLAENFLERLDHLSPIDNEQDDYTEDYLEDQVEQEEHIEDQHLSEEEDPDEDENLANELETLMHHATMKVTGHSQRAPPDGEEEEGGKSPGCTSPLLQNGHEEKEQADHDSGSPECTSPLLGGEKDDEEGPLRDSMTTTAEQC